MNVLLLSPHTDDIELGCGGAVVKFIENGNKLLWVVFSTAEESLPKGMPKDALKKEFLNVVNGLGMSEDDCLIHSFAVRKLHEYRQEILEELVRIRNDYKPDIVIGPSLNDFHQDHQVIANEMVRAYKRSSAIICYELPWNHVTFDTQLFVKLTGDHMRKKCDMLKHYQSQIEKRRAYFAEESIYGLAKIRGIQCDSEYAEAFEVVRWMI